MHISRVGIALAVAALGVAVAGTTNAAQQGTLGATSQGTLNITLSIDALVQITDLDDIDLGTYNGTGPLSGSDNICVYSNNGGFDITATGGGGGGAFILGGTTTTLPYTVQWANTSGATTGTALATGTPLSGQTATFSGPNCGGGTNTTVIVTVGDTDLSAAPTDTYAGVLTLLVAPQ